MPGARAIRGAFGGINSSLPLLSNTLEMILLPCDWMGWAGRVTVLVLVLALSALDKHKAQEMVFSSKTKRFLCFPPDLHV